jgi:F420-dependent oxidoreductase-like protein
MKIGLQIPRFSWPGSPESTGATLARIVRTADDAGFTSLWLMDHFFQIPSVGPVEAPMFESYSTLGYIAAVTRRARLGTMVTGVVYRHPGLLIKAVTGLDVLSGGRVYLGIGAAWNEREALGLGLPFPPLKERFERLEETLQIARQVWSGSTAEYRGKYYHLAEPIISPAPITRPHPPILIGGSGEKKTLRLVARYADACNLFARMGEDEVARKLDVLKRHCEDVGRDYDEIERTALIGLPAGGVNASEVIHKCRELADLGIQHVIFNVADDYTITPLDTFGREVIPAVAGF